LLLAALIPLFALARFSFGYIVGITFFGLIARIHLADLFR